LDCGLKVLDCGLKVLDCGLKVLDCGLKSFGFHLKDRDNLRGEMIDSYFHIFFVWLVALTITLVGVIACEISKQGRQSRPSVTLKEDGGGTCSSTSCGAIDPVNDPDYNMREVIKNTLLIEQHLSDFNKFCRQCIVKHFLISIALLEEAIWMAGSSRGKYAMLEDSLPFHRELFNMWYKHIENADTRVEVLEKLRVWRRQASELYFPT
jgi:hypothetical protein